MRLTLSLFLFALLLSSAPPGASVRRKLQVDPSLRRGPFAADRYLNVPPGFTASLIAIVPGARYLALAPNGDVFVSEPGAGRISIIHGSQATPYATGLTKPHGMVFHSIGDTTWLYVSESNQINRFKYNSGDSAAHDRQIVVKNLPDSSLPELRGSYGHELKNIALGPDHKLYVAIGSTCNVCVSDTTSDPVRAAIYVYDADGSNGRLFARGLRNAEGLGFVPGTNTLWAAVNNRDNIPNPADGRVTEGYVDDHPPDLFTPVRDGGNYGWPFCNSNPDAGLDNMPFDRDLDTNRSGLVDCSQMDIVARGIQAHSAPLGLTFLQSASVPVPYRNGAVLALHGSWNRSQRTGYKAVYYPFSVNTRKPGAMVDLATGFDDGQNVWARPVDVIADQSGNFLISDDQSGGIFKLAYNPASSSAASGYAVVAPGSIASVYGTGFPMTDFTLTVNGLPAKVLYASATQINYVVPAATALGDADLRIETQSSTRDLGFVTVVPVAPGLFSLSGDGTGVAAATAVRRVIPTNITSPVGVFSCDASGVNCRAIPINVGVDAPVYLSLYGTGIHNETSLSNITATIAGLPVQVFYAGPQGTYDGLDQVNVLLPISLRGKGLVDVVVTVDGIGSNTVNIAIE